MITRRILIGTGITFAMAGPVLAATPEGKLFKNPQCECCDH